MNINLLKKVPIALAALAFSSATAAMDMDSRVTQLEHQMQQVRTETAMSNYGALTAPASPAVQNGYGWFINFGILYEQARVGGTEFVYSDQNTVASDFPLRGSLREAKPDWNFGLEAGIGINLGHDNWDVHLDYVHYTTDGRSKVSGGLNGSLVALRGTSSLVNYTNVTEALTNIDVKTDMIQLQLGRNYYVSSSVSLRPFWGVETAWVKLKQLTQYSGGTPLNVDTVHVNDNSKFWGLGPQTGLYSKWFLGHGFGIYGDFTGAVLYGLFDVNHDEFYTAEENNRRITLTGDVHRFVPYARLGLGLSWDGYFDDNRHHIGLMIGYDSTYYWRVNQWIKIDDDARMKYERYSEDLGVQGVKFEARWDF